MKKLMIAAAAAAMVGGAFADCIEVTPGPAVSDNYPVYQFKANLKTTKGVAAGIAATSVVCGEGSDASVSIYRTKDSIALSGWMFGTENCTCDGWLDAALVWDTKRRTQLTDATFAFGLADNTPNVMGRTCTEAEAFWLLTGTFNYGNNRAQTISLYGAGLGTFNRRNATFSLSGNAAGTMSASYDLTLTLRQFAALGDDACKASQVSKCDAVWCDGSQPVDSDTVVYGTWSMKYNQSMTTRYNRVLSIAALTHPAYVTVATAAP